MRNLANQQKQEAGTETETPLPKQWKVGDRCLFHWKMDGLWYQSAIKEITTSGDYVIVMDHSQEVHKTSAPFEIKEQGKYIPSFFPVIIRSSQRSFHDSANIERVRESGHR